MDGDGTTGPWVGREKKSDSRVRFTPAYTLGVSRIAAALALWAAAPSALLAAPENPYEVELGELWARLGRDRSRPEGVVAVLRAASLEEQVAPERLQNMLRSVAEAPDADALVAAHARYLWAIRLERRGDDKGAERAREPLGLFDAYFVLGPFDNEGRAGHARVFPPETEAVPGGLDARYPGKEREIGWRNATPGMRRGSLHFDALLRPDVDATAYARTWVRSVVARDAALRIGSSGPTRAWVNGRLVLDRDAIRSAALDQDAAPVRLRRGWNLVLLKVGVTQGSWRLFARLTDPGGRPLRPGSDIFATPITPAAPVARPDRRDAHAAPVRNLTDLLSGEARRSPAGAAGADAWWNLGRFHVLAHPGDRDAHEAEAAMREAVARDPSDRNLLGLADAADEDDDSRRALERALGVAPPGPRRAVILARLGAAARSGRREALALGYYRQALVEDAAHWPATLALAAERRGAGLPSAGLALLDALPPGFGEIAQVRRERAAVLEALGRRDQALAEKRAVWEARRDDVELLRDVAEAARSVADLGAPAKWLSLAAALRPDAPSLTIDLARTLEGLGAVDQALCRLRAATLRLPDEPRLHEEVGKLLHRLGHRDEAIEQLQRALELRPQNPDLRRYAEGVVAESAGAASTGGEDLARRYAADAEALAAARPAKVEAGADGAVVLLDRRAVRVHPNGLSETFAQRVTEIRTERGARDFSQFFVRYNAGSEDVEIRQARAFRRAPDGGMEVLEAAGRDDRDLSEPWYGLYYDTRAEVVRWDGLRPGDVTEIQYVVANVSSRNEMADYFGDVQMIAEGVPKLRWDYTLIGPAQRTFHFNQPRIGGGLRPAVSEEGGTRVFAFSSNNVPRIDAEPAMPGWAEVAPYLHVSTFKSWVDVGAWYARLIEPQLAADDSVRQAARGAVRPGMTEEEKVRAIHGLVVRQTRYVALEFGIHGYKPYKVTQVLQRKFGDCKDKASLLVALLREIGVPAEVVLVRTRRGGDIDPEPASLAVFDHAVAFVPSLGLYLDGTAEFSGTGELPAQDQGTTALHVGPGGGRLCRTPVLPSAQNRVARRWEVALDPAGGARVVENVTITGQAAPEWREHYQTPGERLERYGKVWNNHYPGTRVESVEMPGLADVDSPVRVSAVAAIPRVGQAGAGGLELPSATREPDYLRSYARLGARRHDLVLGYPWQHDESIAYTLAAGWEVARLPAARSLDSPFGRFALEVDRDGHVVRVHSRLDVVRHRLPPADYGEFRRFLGDVDAALGQRILVRSGAGP